MKKIVSGLLISTISIYALSAKQASLACPTQSMLHKLIAVGGSLNSRVRIYPSCKVLYKGMNIHKVIQEDSAHAQVLWRDINGNSRIDFIPIEAL
jgi:hypothetical protein